MHNGCIGDFVYENKTLKLSFAVNVHQRLTTHIHL